MPGSQADVSQPDGRRRVIVERVRPEIDCGAAAVKRMVGDVLVVEADIFADGHDLVAGEVLYRHAREEHWRRAPMKPFGNDRWRGEFLPAEIGQYEYTVEGWIDRFGTWRSAYVQARSTPDRTCAWIAPSAPT